jgi:hypothetical protein
MTVINDGNDMFDQGALLFGDKSSFFAGQNKIFGRIYEVNEF